MPRTLEEIRIRGLEVLRRELGRVGLVRFLQQFSVGEGDYSRARREWVDSTSLKDLLAAGKSRSVRKRKRKTS
jgi:hypothetical protein